MSNRRGVTLLELIVVIVILGVALSLTFISFTNPIEQAKASNAQNNLIAIYSAQKNFLNNSNPSSYCLAAANTAIAGCASGADTSCADSLAQINCNLSLQIQDDGSYTYQCSAGTCTATRNIAAATPVLTLTLTAPLQLTGGVNPTCTPGNAWCPQNLSI